MALFSKMYGAASRRKLADLRGKWKPDGALSVTKQNQIELNQSRGI
jgi:hypothetical protein